MTTSYPLIGLLTSEVDGHILIQKCAGKIKSLVSRTAQDTVDIGQSLIEANHQLSPGCFETWVNAEFGWSLTLANKFMQVATRFGSANFADTTISTLALYLLTEATTLEAASPKDLDRTSHEGSITFGVAQETMSQCKELASYQFSELLTVDVSSELVEPKFP